MKKVSCSKCGGNLTGTKEIGFDINPETGTCIPSSSLIMTVCEDCDEEMDSDDFELDISNIDYAGRSLNRKEFLELLAHFIKAEVNANTKEFNDSLCEPYRRMGDKLIDEALALID